METWTNPVKRSASFLAHCLYQVDQALCHSIWICDVQSVTTAIVCCVLQAVAAKMQPKQKVVKTVPKSAPRVGGKR